MRFTFIIPTYNDVSTLRACVDSLPDNAEILIINDGSTDGTGELAERLAEENARLKVIHTENRGVSAARNRGLLEARGDYILFVDADDIVEKDRLSECMRILESHTDIDMLLYSRSQDHYKNGRLHWRDKLILPVQGFLTAGECYGMIDRLFDSSVLYPIYNKIIKKSILTGIRFQEEMFILEDLEFSVRALANCRRLFFYQDMVYHQRYSVKGTARIRRMKRLEEVMNPIRDAFELLPCDTDYMETSINAMLEREIRRAMSLKELRAHYPGKVCKYLFERLKTRIWYFYRRLWSALH